jgi:hypothetical protein
MSLASSNNFCAENSTTSSRRSAATFIPSSPVPATCQRRLLAVLLR